MKKITLTNVKNIKNLNREELENYSAKVPVIINSLIETLDIEKDNLEKRNSLIDKIFNYSKKFYLVGDVFASIKLIVSLITKFENVLSKNQLYKINSILALYFTASGDVDRGEYYNNEAFKLAKSEADVLYVVNLYVQALVAFENGNFELSLSSSKRGIDYVYLNQLKKTITELPLPIETIIFQLTKLMNLSNMELADTYPEGSLKRKSHFETVSKYLKKLSKLQSGKLKFYYYCEKSLYFSKLNDPGNAEKYLDKVFKQMQYKKGFATTHNYYYYITTAFYHSQFKEFAESYANARMAVRASFNHHDVISEHYVMNSFLDLAKEYSRTLPEFRSKKNEYRFASDSMMKQFVDILEEKDWYTGKQHSRRVAELSYMIGKKMLTLFPYLRSQLDLEILYSSAYMHDIGKLRLPWALLNKIGKLEDYEMSFLMNHVKFGKDILEKLNFKEVAKIVYQHHENLDGKGYPEGTKNISIAANIISISDSFEAMTNPNRKYKKKQKSILIARDELISLEGKKYYPEIIKAFKMLDLKLFEKKILDLE